MVNTRKDGAANEEQQQQQLEQQQQQQLRQELVDQQQQRHQFERILQQQQDMIARMRSEMLELKESNNNTERDERRDAKEKRDLDRKDVETLNNCKIKLFSGDDNVDSWWRKVEGFIAINEFVFNRITEAQQVGFIKSLLAEDVHMLIDRDQNLKTLDNIKRKLLETYKSQDHWPRKLFFARQEESESIKDFLKRVRQMVNKTDKQDHPMSKFQMDEIILHTFWFGCKSDIEEQLTLKNPNSIEEAYQLALIVEEMFEKKNVSLKRKVIEGLKVTERRKKDDQEAEEDTSEYVDEDFKEAYKGDLVNQIKQLQEKVKKNKNGLESLYVMTNKDTDSTNMVPNKTELIPNMEDKMKIMLQTFFDKSTNHNTGNRSYNNNNRSSYYNNQDNRFNKNGGNHYRNNYNTDSNNHYSNNNGKNHYYGENRNNNNMVCEHCNKPNHSFETCRHANEQQKEALRLNSDRAPQSSVGKSA
jgi:hypothetical protein